MAKWKLWTTLALALLVAIVVLQNTDPAKTRVLWATIEMPRFVLLLTCALVGGLFGFVLGRRSKGAKAK